MPSGPCSSIWLSEGLGGDKLNGIFAISLVFLLAQLAIDKGRPASFSGFGRGPVKKQVIEFSPIGSKARFRPPEARKFTAGLRPHIGTMESQSPDHLTLEEAIILGEVNDLIQQIKVGAAEATPHELDCLERYRSTLAAAPEVES